MKKLISVLIASVMLLSVTACGSKQTGTTENETTSVESSATEKTAEEATTESSSKKTIAVLTPNATHGFLGESIKHAEAGTKELSEKYGLEYKFLTSSESSEQNNQIDSLINEKVDGIILWPHNGDELRSGAMKVQEAGIPIVIYDRLITGFVPTVEVMGDNTKIGEMTAEYFNKYFADALAAGEVQILEFKGDNSTVPQQRSDGFASKANPNLKIVQQFSTDWQRQKAMEQLETLLTTSSVEDIEKIKAVFTHDDEVALGILDAIENYKGTAKLDIKLISGVGGRKENLDTFAPVKEKLGIDQVTYEFSPSMIRDAIEIGIKVVSGEKIEGLVLIPTKEIDNSNEAEYRNSEVYKIRYGN